MAFYKRPLGKHKPVVIQTPKDTPFPDDTQDEEASGSNSSNIPNILNAGHKVKLTKRTKPSK